MATKIDKIKERKAALLAKLKELEKEESTEASAEKKARRQEDTRTKTLLGITVAMSLKESRSAALIGAVSRNADKLTASDKKFLSASRLWNELGLPMPLQDAQEAPKTGAQGTQTESAVESVSEDQKTPPAPSNRVSQAITPLPKARFYDKDEVKALGAVFNSDNKNWQVPPGVDLAAFEKWL